MIRLNIITTLILVFQAVVFLLAFLLKYAHILLLLLLPSSRYMPANIVLLNFLIQIILSDSNPGLTNYKAFDIIVI
jgi:hypothetical protein